LFGNTYYVGPHGLSAILVTSPQGHVLVDAGLPQSAPVIAEHIRALGFRLDDVKVIAFSHVHYDHAGGVAELQRLTGATVVASPIAARALRAGQPGPDDPQFGILMPITPVATVREVHDGEVVRVGSVALTVHFTPGHTPGGTSWSWRACEGATCHDVVYADSQTPVSADDFLFTKSPAYPNVLGDFARGLATLEGLRCDLLLTPHPDASGLWERLAKRDAGDANALIDARACVTFVAAARQRVADRVAKERAGR
jgi:metallo-beta-lactamase class B